MIRIPSAPPFTHPSDADDTTRHALLTCHRVHAVEKQLATLDRAHTRLVALLADLDPVLNAIYVTQAQQLREYLPTLASDVDGIYDLAAPAARAYQEAKYQAARRRREEHERSTAADSNDQPAA